MALKQAVQHKQWSVSSGSFLSMKPTLIIQCVELYRKSVPKADFPGASADFLLWGFNFAIFSKDGFG